MNTFWYNEDNVLILEENYTYERTFKSKQSVVINSVEYQVVRHNINTDGDHIIFVKKLFDLQTSSC